VLESYPWDADEEERRLLTGVKGASTSIFWFEERVTTNRETRHFGLLSAGWSNYQEIGTTSASFPIQHLDLLREWEIQIFPEKIWKGKAGKGFSSPFSSRSVLFSLGNWNSFPFWMLSF